MVTNSPNSRWWKPGALFGWQRGAGQVNTETGTAALLYAYAPNDKLPLKLLLVGGTPTCSTERSRVSFEAVVP